MLPSYIAQGNGAKRSKHTILYNGMGQILFQKANSIAIQEAVVDSSARYGCRLLASHSRDTLLVTSKIKMNGSKFFSPAGSLWPRAGSTC